MACVGLCVATGAPAQDAKGPGSDADTAQQLSNPLAALISVPLQSNFDFDGANGRSRYLLNVQPVVPLKLNDDLDLISRTVIPISKGDGADGLGDIVESMFLSPKPAHGFTYGVGPAIELPTATSRSLGSRQLGIGPTAIVVHKAGPMLFGLLVNHLWGVTGSTRAADHIDATFIQPFASYTWPSRTTVGVNTESSYDGHAGRWTVPINLLVSQLTKVGGQQVQFGLGPRYYAVAVPGAERWGIRLNVTFVFPTRSGNAASAH